MRGHDSAIVGKFPRTVREIENAWIPMRDGCRLAARIWLPEDAEFNPVPAILEYLPYRKRDGTVQRDALTHPYFAGHGYAAVRVDIRGNGDSDGLMFDEYLAQEQDDALEVIDWLTRQPWCSGRVGMMGISWGGFNALQVAARNPPALLAVVTVCSTDDRFADDVHYKGGALLLDNAGWAATMFACSARAPDPVLVGERWREMWLERLRNTPLLIENWLAHPHRDAYWKHGSVCEEYEKITAPVLAVGGWGDAYSNAVPRMLSGLHCQRRGIVGPWLHNYPHLAVPGPRIHFLKECLRWWDQWLKDQPTGVLQDPFYRAYILECSEPQETYEVCRGRWVSEDVWPSASINWTDYHLHQDGLRATPGDCRLVTVDSPQWVGAAAGKYCATRRGPELPGDQRSDDAGSVVFDSEPLSERIEILGAPEVVIRAQASSSQGVLAVRLCDVHPGGASTRVSYATVNLCHHESHEFPQELVAGEWYEFRIRLDDVGYAFPSGNRLRVSISTTYWPIIWPAGERVQLGVECGSKSFLRLPVRPAQAGERVEFDAERYAPPMKVESLREERHRRVLERDVAGESTRTVIEDDYGEWRLPGLGLITGECAQEIYTISDHDPLSARAEFVWETTTAREEWRTRTRTYTSMTCDRDFFYIDARMQAFEGEREFFAEKWERRVARKLV